jgi:DNA-binding XRE family transcriptional regulator
MQTLKEAREARGIKQKAVANALQVSRQTYSNYEKNPDTMPVFRAKAACSFIGCDINEIFFSSGVS